MEPLVFRHSLVLEFLGGPSSSVSGLHVGHCPHNFGGVVVKGFWAEADIGAARRQELLPLDRSPSNSEGVEGLREIFFHLAEEAGIGVG